MVDKPVEYNQRKEYLENIDPFEVPLDYYKSLNSDEDWLLTNRLFSLYGEWIQTKFQEHAAESLVLCDRKVVFVSNNRYEPADEQVIELEAEMGKPCYVVTRDPMIEEQTGWSRLSGNDYYPTLEVYVGNLTWDDEKVFSDGQKVRCDFDTGNPDYVVLNANTCRSVSGRFSSITRRGRHLGWPYRFYPYRMKVCIIDGQKGRCMSKIVEGIEDWETPDRNPYKLVNSNREGFLGRDIMLRLLVKVILDPESKESVWELL